MSADLPRYEIHAVRYAHHDRRASENFLGGDPHDVNMPLDYYVWAVVGNGRTYIVDTGFTREQAVKRKRDLLRPPGEGLQAIGIDPDRVEDVILSHMHYDHAGNLDLFPKARFHIQDREMEYCTGRSMGHPSLSFSFEPAHVTAMIQRIFAGRAVFHDGNAEIAPGISVHHLGGHTKGLQAVRVMTQRGWVMLASDGAHLYAHLEQGRVFPVVYNVAEMLEGQRKLRELATSPAHIIPGHDPLVMQRYETSRPGLDGIAVRVDLEPLV